MADQTTLRRNLNFWKKKSEIEIDYFALFMCLWIAFDTWLAIKYKGISKMGKRVNSVKTSRSNNLVYDNFYSLIKGKDNYNKKFKGQFCAFMHLLDRQKIKNDKGTKTLSLSKFFATEDGDDIIQMNISDYIRGKEKDIDKMYEEYLTIVCDLRNLAFHGKLRSIKSNKDLFRLLYLTFKPMTNGI